MKYIPRGVFSVAFLAVGLYSTLTVLIYPGKKAKSPFTFVDDIARRVTVNITMRRAVVSKRYGVEFIHAINAMDKIVSADCCLFDDKELWPELTDKMRTYENSTQLNSQQAYRRG